MKRFYCTVCKRVRRVRNLPRVIDISESGYIDSMPREREGVCNRHTASVSYRTRPGSIAAKVGAR